MYNVRVAMVLLLPPRVYTHGFESVSKNPISSSARRWFHARHQDRPCVGSEVMSLCSCSPVFFGAAGDVNDRRHVNSPQLAVVGRVFVMVLGSARVEALAQRISRPAGAAVCDASGATPRNLGRATVGDDFQAIFIRVVLPVVSTSTN